MNGDSVEQLVDILVRSAERPGAVDMMLGLQDALKELASFGRSNPVLERAVARLGEHIPTRILDTAAEEG